MADLSEFLQQHTPKHEGPDFRFLDRGRYLGAVRQLKHGAEDTLLAVALWQIIVETREFAGLLGSLGLTPLPWHERDARVVIHGDPRHRPDFDLLILDSSFGDTPRSVQIKPSPSDLYDAFEKWQGFRNDNLAMLLKEDRIGRRQYSDVSSLINKLLDRDFAVGAVDFSSFYIVAARLPDLRYTSLPASPWPVSTTTGGPSASAGAVVRSQTNPQVVGVTISTHLLLPHGCGNAIGMGVLVNGQPGTVVSCDIVSDSCFVQLARIGPPTHQQKASQGPVRGGVAPAQGTTGFFEGCGSGGRMSGQITSVSVNTFAPHPLVQQRFDLNTLTNSGDSGCALVDGNDHILGFAHSCTSPMSNPSFSTWIWADSVFSAHKLQAF